MARERITPGIIRPSEEEIESLTGKGAERGLVPWIPEKWKREIAIALGLATAGGVGTGAGVAAFNWYLEHRPAITEEISAAQIPPEIVVPSGSSAPEVERLPVEVEEKIPSQEVSPKTEAITSLNINYTIRPYDTLSEIAQRFGTTQEEILALNPEIKDPNIVPIGESIVIPEVSVEKTVEFLQDLQKKVNEIYELRSKRVEIGEPYVVEPGDTLWDIAERYKVSVDTILRLNLNITNPKRISPGQEIKMPRAEDPVPSETLGAIFSRVENDLTRIQGFVGEGQEDSLEARVTAKEIMEYWNIASGEQEEVRTPEIIVNPKAERGEWIASQLREFLGYLPDSGRVVEKIFIEPRETWPNWPHDAGMFSFSDHGAHIWIFSPRRLGARWTKSELLRGFFHEFSHGVSLYSEGYNLRFIPPAEVVNLVYEDTLIWERRHQSLGIYWPVNEEESNANIVPAFILGEEDVFYAAIDPEIIQARLEFGNHWFSKQLGKDIDLVKLGEQMGFRRAKIAD